MPSRTALYDCHLAAKARMVDFAGWDMPVQYTSIAEEHQAVRQHAGLFDVSHMGRLSFSGTGAINLIQHVWTNDASAMKDFQVRYGLICNAAGGILDDVLVYRWPYGWSMVVNASNREKIVQHLNAVKGKYDVEITDQTLSTCMIALQGPSAAKLVAGLFDMDVTTLGYYKASPTRYLNQGCVVSRTGYTGEDGFEFMVKAEQGPTLWNVLLDRGAKPCGLGSRDTLRLEAAMPLYGHELSETIDPIAAGLDWAVKLTKDHFLGKAAMEQAKAMGTHRRRVGLKLAGKRIAREGAVVKQGGANVGVVASGTFSPTLQATIAMAYVNADCAAVGTNLVVDIRGNDEAASVVPLPFYKRK